VIMSRKRRARRLTERRSIHQLRADAAAARRAAAVPPLHFTPPIQLDPALTEETTAV
jgi:hypothetical protein